MVSHCSANSRVVAAYLVRSSAYASSPASRDAITAGATLLERSWRAVA
jgi:hypothetical protein